MDWVPIVCGIYAGLSVACWALAARKALRCEPNAREAIQAVLFALASAAILIGFA